MEEIGIFALGFGLTFGVLAIAEHIADEFQEVYLNDWNLNGYCS